MLAIKQGEIACLGNLDFDSRFEKSLTGKELGHLAEGNVGVACGVVNT